MKKRKISKEGVMKTCEKKRIEIGNQIDKGSFGTIYDCDYANNENKFVVKKLSHEHMDEFRILEILKMMGQCSYVLEMIDMVKMKENCFGIIFPKLYCNLSVAMRANPNLIRNNRKLYLKQLVEGLDFLKRANVIHSDLKAHNILIAEDCTKVLICDFGNSCHVTNGKFGVSRGTYNVMPPEFFPECCTVTFSTDVWSLGCIYYYLKSGLFPFVSLLEFQKSDVGITIYDSLEIQTIFMNELDHLISLNDDESIFLLEHMLNLDSKRNLQNIKESSFYKEKVQNVMNIVLTENNILLDDSLSKETEDVPTLSYIIWKKETENIISFLEGMKKHRSMFIENLDHIFENLLKFCLKVLPLHNINRPKTPINPLELLVNKKTFNISVAVKSSLPLVLPFRVDKFGHPLERYVNKENDRNTWYVGYLLLEFIYWDCNKTPLPSEVEMNKKQIKKFFLNNPSIKHLNYSFLCDCIVKNTIEKNPSFILKKYF